jgi:peptidyl-tRNA hydrolase, PTH1 family
VQLPWSRIKIDREGSAGSHNGAKSVIGTLGTQEFLRLRLGCGPDHPVSNLKQYVLRPMRKAELEMAAEEVADAAEAVELILSKGVEAAMNKYNRRKPPEAAEAGQ